MMDYKYIIVFELTFVYGMISLPDDALTARLIVDIDRMVRYIVIHDSIRHLDQNGREVRRKIAGGIISDGLQIYYSV